MQRHFLQSPEWADFQVALGHTTLQRSAKHYNLSALVERAHGKLGHFVSRMYLPYGPYAENKQGQKQALDYLDELAKLRRIDYIRIQPFGFVDETLLGRYGYVKQPRDAQPAHTRLVRLKGKTADAICSEFNATNRTMLRKNATLPFPVECSFTSRVDDIDDFLDMMRHTSQRSGAVFHSGTYFRTLLSVLGSQKAAGLVYAQVNAERLASALYLVDNANKTLFYLHAGSYDEARQHGAGNILLMELILKAKKMGMHRVDLFGVAPKDAGPDHRLSGISQFKRSFGGEDVAYSGTWEKPVNGLKYALVKRLRK
jgi:lipid II:glycine glycyltransferase (peptidoglycan interpeptide bridge formation enzyme)